MNLPLKVVSEKTGQSINGLGREMIEIDGVANDVDN